MKKKNNLKKLALLGITGGVILSSECQADQINLNVDQLIAKNYNNSYGGGGSCGAGSCGGASYSGSHCGAGSCGGANYNGCGAPQPQFNRNSCGATAYGGPGTYETPSYDQYHPEEQSSAHRWQQQGQQTQSHQAYPQSNYPQSTYPQSSQPQYQNPTSNPTNPASTVSPTSYRNNNNNNNKLLSENTTMHKATLTDAEFRAKLSDENKRLYDRLDAEGKKLALDHANQGKDPNQAVKAVSEKRAGKSNFQGKTQTKNSNW